MSPALEERIAPLVRTTRIIWAAFLAAVPVYVVVAHLVFSRTEAPTLTPVAQPVLLLFSAAALASAVAALVLPRFHPSASVLRRLAQPEAREKAVGLPARGSPRRSEAAAGLRPAEERAYSWAALFPTHCISRFAFAESIVIYGFVVSFLTRRPEYTIYFGIPCLLVMILIFPRIEPFMARGKHAVTG